VRHRLYDLRCSLDAHWLVQVERDLAIPRGLSRRGKEAARLILDFLLAEGLTRNCGCQAFYHPKEWKERGEEFGHDALLILVYDSGDMLDFMDPVKGQGKIFDRFDQNLHRHDFVLELCTHWYSAIYNAKNYKPFQIALG
jgi:hypothetical protein